MANRNKKEEELQNLIFGKENQNHISGDFSEDAELYRLIRENLKEEPKFALSPDFARITTKKAIKRKRLQAAYKMIFSYSAIALCLLAIGGVTFYLLAKETLNEFLSVISNYGLQLLFFAIMIICIQLIDKLFIRKDEMSRNAL